MSKVQMAATAFFTRNSPTTGAILHGDDRKEADAIARYPLVSEEDAAYLEREKLAKRHDGRVPAEDEDADNPAETIGDRAARVMEDHTEADQSVDQSTGLDTRASTVFEKPVEDLAGASGSGRSMIDAEDTTTDEAPAGGRRGRGGKASARSESTEENK
jgi:hypothetical protein